MRKLNETERQCVKGLQSAKWSWKEICDVIALIKWHIALGEKLDSASIDHSNLNLKFSDSHRYEIARVVA